MVTAATPTSGQRALILWSRADSQDAVLAQRSDLQAKAGRDVALELFEHIGEASIPSASYDLITTGPAYPRLPFTDEVYAVLSRALAPSGWLAYEELVLTNPAGAGTALPKFRDAQSLLLALKLAGFVSPSIEATRPLSEAEADALASGAWNLPVGSGAGKAAVDAGLCVATITAAKPSYATGSASAIKLPLRSKKPAEQPQSRSPAPALVGWSDSSEDGELEDEDALLDELDRAKPAKVDDCEMTDGKRKACKNCVCGRAEEEAAEAAVVTISSDEATGAVIGAKEVKSSCGSCYLGDAFRCSTCPYLGMPAFEPGQKVELTGIFASADIDFE
ncbi:cytokine-induced anti-apoptosis inhibitor 1, Fe-S biogenesis-domain-containing protein [Hyaloraphidium curvatum]|nr:cytokine-induced anti-apoptosis inhibitor 1, Fe-S biogenesis-domain-containing protein [Hyaloraphidium curvatum]